MGGGVSMPAVSSSSEALLKERHAKLKAEGVEDAAINEQLAKALPMISAFSQIDADSTGKITKENLIAFLKTLPPPPEGAATIDELHSTLDLNGDGGVDVNEWVTQLDKFPMLKKKLMTHTNPATGKIDPAYTKPDAPPPSPRADAAAAAAVPPPSPRADAAAAAAK